jgi:hypothetical protein
MTSFKITRPMRFCNSISSLQGDLLYGYLLVAYKNVVTAIKKTSVQILVVVSIRFFYLYIKKNPSIIIQASTLKIGHVQ